MQASIIAFEPTDQRTRELVHHMMNFSLGNTQADIEEENQEVEEQVNHDDWFSEEEDEEEADGVLPEWLAAIANRAPQPAQANEHSIFNDVINP